LSDSRPCDVASRRSGPAQVPPAHERGRFQRRAISEDVSLATCPRLWVRPTSLGGRRSPPAHGGRYEFCLGCLTQSSARSTAGRTPTALRWRSGTTSRRRARSAPSSRRRTGSGTSLDPTCVDVDSVLPSTSTGRTPRLRPGLHPLRAERRRRRDPDRVPGLARLHPGRALRRRTGHRLAWLRHGRRLQRARLHRLCRTGAVPGREPR